VVIQTFLFEQGSSTVFRFITRPPSQMEKECLLQHPRPQGWPQKRQFADPSPELRSARLAYAAGLAVRQ